MHGCLIRKKMGEADDPIGIEDSISGRRKPVFGTPAKLSGMLGHMAGLPLSTICFLASEDPFPATLNLQI